MCQEALPYLPSSETTAPPGDRCPPSPRREDAKTPRRVYLWSAPPLTAPCVDGAPPATPLSLTSATPLTAVPAASPCCPIPFWFRY